MFIGFPLMRFSCEGCALNPQIVYDNPTNIESELRCEQVNFFRKFRRELIHGHDCDLIDDKTRKSTLLYSHLTNGVEVSTCNIIL